MNRRNFLRGLGAVAIAAPVAVLASQAPALPAVRAYYPRLQREWPRYAALQTEYDAARARYAALIRFYGVPIRSAAPSVTHNGFNFGARYNVGDYVVQDGKLYRVTSAVHDETTVELVQ
jgi:hypothetical protein